MGFENYAFISWCHSLERRGKELVFCLQEELEDRLTTYLSGGGSIFLDERRLDTGFVFDKALRLGLCRSAATIVIVTDNYFKSDYCRTEWALTETLQDYRLPSDIAYETCFIPLLLCGDVDLPREVQSLRYRQCLLSILVSGRDWKQHPKWMSLVDDVFQDIKRICSHIATLSGVDWETKETLALQSGEKKFTWPEKKTVPSKMPRKGRSLFNIAVEETNRKPVTGKEHESGTR